MSAKTAKRDTHRDKNKTAARDKRRRCRGLFNTGQCAGHKDNEHLKPVLSWILERKLPALPINGYVCWGCRRKLYKLKDDLKKLQLSKREVHRGLMQLARKPYVVLDRRLADSCHRNMRLLSKDLLQLLHGSPPDSVPLQEERWQNKYQNDDEKKLRSGSSEQFNSQKTGEQIADDSVKLNPSSSVESAPSGIITDTNKTCQTKIQKRSLPVKKSSDNAIPNSIQEMKDKNSHINSNITLTNGKDTSAERSSTKVKLSPVSKNKSPSKLADNSVRDSENKSLHSKSNTISAKNKSINKEHSSPRNKLSESVPNQVKKHHSKSSIDSLKNEAIFEKKRKQDEKKQKGETEVKQESSPSKIKPLNSRGQERDYASKSNDTSCENNINVSRDTIISNLKTDLEAETKDVADENQDASISNVQISRVDSELLPEQTHTPVNKIFVKVDLHQTENIKTKLTNRQRDSLPVEIDSKTTVKKRIHPASSDESVLMKKMQKKKETSSNKSLDENLMSDVEIFDREEFSEDKQIFYHNAIESEKQMYCENEQKRQNKIKRIREKFRNWFQVCFPSKSESDEEYKIISECLEKRKLQFVSNNSEIYDMFSDITTEEETEDFYKREEISVHRHDMSFNSQEDIESVISMNAESVNSSDSTICIENDTLHDCTTDEEIEKTDSNRDKTSTRKRDISVDTSQENIESIIPAKVQRIEDSALIADAETVNNSEDAIYVETTDISMQSIQENQENIDNIKFEDAYVETKEVSMQSTQENQENIDDNLADLADVNLDEDMKISKDIRPNLELSTMSAQELISNINEKDGCDASQNVENVSLITNNEDIAKNITTVITDHASIMSPKLKEDSSVKKGIVNKALSSPTANVLSRRSNTNDHSTDDDNISDIEVEIKIKPRTSKSKSRISRKFSLKAPLSAVHTCITNLNTIKNNPDFLGELFQMNLKPSSENSKHGNTIRSEENEASKNISDKSSDVNQSITTETIPNTQEVICNSSHTTKNMNNFSRQQQRQSSQDDTVIDKNKNATQRHQEEKNKQSVEQQTMQVISENDSEARNASDLEKQLPKTSSNDKENIANEQQKNPQDNIISNEGGDATERDQEEKNERLQSVEQKETATENNAESIKSARDIPLEEQLPKTSAETKRIGGVRVRTCAELGSSWSSIPLNLSINREASSNNTHSAPSTSSTYRPPPHNSATKSAYHLPMPNLPDALTENISSNFNNNIINLMHNIILNVCTNFTICRNIFLTIRKKSTAEIMFDLRNRLTYLFQNIESLRKLFVTSIDDVINYINQTKLLTPPISTVELMKYRQFYDDYLHITFPDTRSNMPQPSNIDNSSVPSTSIPNIYAQSPFLGNVPTSLPGTRMHFTTQASTMPCPGPNINQSQSTRSTGNPSRLRQPVPNVRPNVSSTSISVPNLNPYPINQQQPNLNPYPINQQQPVGNASYVQGQRMPNISNVNNQQFFVHPSNITYTSSSAASASNINTHVNSPNKNNTNVSSTTRKKYSRIKPTKITTTTSTNSATAAPVSNNRMQQQNQILYSQTPIYVNPGIPLFVTNQNINANPIICNVTQPSQIYTSVNAPRNSANVTVNVSGNIGPGNSQFINPQTQAPPISAKQSVPQYNMNVPNNSASQFVPVQNIVPIPNQQQQNLQQHLQKLSNSTVIRMVNLSSNDISQNAQSSVPNKRTGIPETQTRDHMPNTTSFAKPQQDVCQGMPYLYNILQKSSSISPKTPVSQESSVSQNATSNATSVQKKKIIIKSKPKIILTPSPNKIMSSHFETSVLTELQKFMLRKLLQFYLEKCEFVEEEELTSENENFERELFQLVISYESLYNYEKLITENHTEENSTLQNEPISNHQSEIQSSRNKTQSNKNNENNSVYDKVQEKQSSEKNINSNNPISAKSTAVKSDLLMEAQSKESHLKSMPKLTTEELSPGTVNLQKQNIDTPKMRFKKNLSLVIRKQSENITTSLEEHSNIPEENPIKTSRKISKTKAQDGAKINKIARSLAENLHDKRLSESCSPLAHETSSLIGTALNDEIKDCTKIAKANAKETENIEIGNICKISNITLNNISGNDAISQSSFNTKTQDNAKDKETVKLPVEDLHDKWLSESCFSPTQNTLSLLQDDKTKDDNVNIEGSDNVETANKCKISNAILNSNGEKNEKTTSQIPCNTEAQDEELNHNEVCNLNNKIFSKNSHDGTHDNIKENTEKSKSNFTEVQFDTPCISRTSTPLLSDNTPELLFSTNRSESVKISQTYTTSEKYTLETSTLFLNTQQEEPTNEKPNDSEKMYDESSDSSGNLYIDESVDKPNSDSQEEQCDKVPSSGEDKSNTSQNLCFDETRCESIKMTLLPSPSEGFELRLLSMEEQNIQKFNAKLKQKDEETKETSPSQVPEDTSSTRGMQSIDTMKQSEDTMENQIQMNTHSGIKAINELLRLVSEHNFYEKAKISSCNRSTVKSNATNENINEAVVEKNDISNVATPAKSEEDPENSVMNILNVMSISSSLFEKIDNSDAFSQDDFALLNEIKEEKSSDVNDNPEVSNSASSNEIKVEESSVLNDNSEVSNSASSNEIKVEESSVLNDSSEVSNSASQNEMKIEESHVIDNTEVLNSTLNEIKIEEVLSLIDNPEISNFTSLNEMKEENSSVVDDNLEVHNSASLNKIKEEKSSNANNNNPDGFSSVSLNEMNEKKSFDVDDNVYNRMWLNEIKEEKLLNLIDNLEISNSSSLNEMTEEKSSVDDNPEVHNFVLSNEMKGEKPLNVNNPNVNNPKEILNSASLNEIKEGKSMDVNDNPEIPDEMENRPCLRCKRKSMVYCQACLEAHYCSKRCSDLHWKAIHYKQCKNRYKSIVCIDL